MVAEGCRAVVHTASPSTKTYDTGKHPFFAGAAHTSTSTMSVRAAFLYRRHLLRGAEKRCISNADASQNPTTRGGPRRRQVKVEGDLRLRRSTNVTRIAARRLRDWAPRRQRSLESGCAMGEAEVCFAWQAQATEEASGKGSSLFMAGIVNWSELSVRGGVARVVRCSSEEPPHPRCFGEWGTLSQHSLVC